MERYSNWSRQLILLSLTVAVCVLAVVMLRPSARSAPVAALRPTEQAPTSTEVAAPPSSDPVSGGTDSLTPARDERSDVNDLRTANLCPELAYGAGTRDDLWARKERASIDTVGRYAPYIAVVTVTGKERRRAEAERCVLVDTERPSPDRLTYQRVHLRTEWVLADKIGVPEDADYWYYYGGGIEVPLLHTGNRYLVFGWPTFYIVDGNLRGERRPDVMMLSWVFPIDGGDRVIEPSGGRTPLPQAAASLGKLAATEPAMPRKEALGYAEGLAHTFGEAGPKLLELSLHTSREQRDRLRALGGHGPTYTYADHDTAGDAQVWLARMEITFWPSALPAATGGVVVRAPTRGWMYALLNARTGDSLEEGFRTREDTIGQALPARSPIDCIPTAPGIVIPLRTPGDPDSGSSISYGTPSVPPKLTREQAIKAARIDPARCPNGPFVTARYVLTSAPGGVGGLGDRPVWIVSVVGMSMYGSGGGVMNGPQPVRTGRDANRELNIIIDAKTGENYGSYTYR